ncbi:glutamine amidotransferase of anthranilate synthase [Desulfitobacterium hafniense DCB-2]|uniref:Glutamine amidotransferase of anthranilate synthase n=2 Tax=root TaxID=1 RepID=B8FVH9_DESHD|nr:aminodeoxychorismate/anthranilate synthase component II [Desulfitobacterium hafniense]ACL22381.1 glutamine amidotransferase of anthranilate synthase [Desulfitobacterium hafniense DCB-2]MEA5021485.1 aminodeoxychorismate/anthranilate synthase component II [Desulfitobacterium hafniense]
MLAIIDNYDSFTYNLVQAFGELGEKVTVCKNDEVSGAEFLSENPDGVVISPGPCTPNEAGISLEVIRLLNERAQEGRPTPLLGVCLGHQALAQAFNSEIILAPEIVHGKQSLIYHDETELFAECTQGFLAGRYHSLMVDPLGLSPLFIVTARTENNLIMGIRHRYFPFYGVQFHPESILTPEGPQILRSFLTQVHHQ